MHLNPVREMGHNLFYFYDLLFPFKVRFALFSLLVTFVYLRFVLPSCVGYFLIWSLLALFINTTDNRISENILGVFDTGRQPF